MRSKYEEVVETGVEGAVETGVERPENVAGGVVAERDEDALEVAAERWAL